MEDIKKVNIKNIEEEFYQKMDEREQPNQSSSCISLVIFCMIIYVVIAYLLWQNAPRVWNIIRRASEVKNNFRIPSKGDALNRLKENASEAVKKTKKDLSNTATEKAEEAVEPTTEASKKRMQNELKKQTETLKSELDSPRENN